VYTGIFSLSDIVVADRYNNYYFSGGVGFAGDDDPATSIRWRFSGAAIGTYATSESFAFHYGLVFSYKFGRGLALPVLGFRWNPAQDWKFKAILPFSWKVDYQAADDVVLGLGMKVDGDRFSFTDEGVLPGQPRSIDLRVTQVELGCDVQLRIAPSILLAGEAGVAGARKIWLSSGDADVLALAVKPAGYSNASVKFSF
jgi:hypothetical protein